MAEFPQLGVRCEVKTCQKLDFLPFLCNECCGKFCSKHRTKVSHGCFTGFKQEKEARLENMQQKSGMQCAFHDCKSELIQVTCEHCCCSYCLRHRHQVDHQCSSLPLKKARQSPEEKIQQIIGKDLSKEKKGRGGVRNEIMAAKVSLMKIKLKATGDVCIPQDERIYLRVLLPYGSNGQEIPMFFSKKLRLIHRNTGEVLGQELQVVDFQKRDNFQLFSGSAVVIEYVDKDCTSMQLMHLDKYPI
ncbi:AN1-type zinc finger protein 1-like isoform X2 [Acropora millepora]|uniref:AN1-type zinc finger protein 1-like isoform X2 n=1 Tax=Acropora millepora TaxID=45264 RepID=UPI0010FC87B0|nr:AN1-type zinc finger protein 1-like isoform X2 [Acropora millepora]